MSNAEADSITSLVVVSMFLFLLSVGLSIGVLMSRKGWIFHQSASGIKSLYISQFPDMPLNEVIFTISAHLEESYRDNQVKLSKLYQRMNWAFSVTVIHIIGMIIVVMLSTGSINMSAQTQPEPKPTQNQPAPNPGQNVPNPGVQETRSTPSPKEPPMHVNTPASE
ncbi:MAG: hypothetical protein AAGG55_13270 [Pseudomonadota bacterium]